MKVPKTNVIAPSTDFNFDIFQVSNQSETTADKAPAPAILPLSGGRVLITTGKRRLPKGLHTSEFNNRKDKVEIQLLDA